MSQCPQCYTGTCKRHAAQDHGRSAARPSNAQDTLQKMYDQLVGAKLQKLRAEAALEDGDRHAGAFRQQLDESRAKSLRKQAKKRSKLADAGVAGSGLNPQALAATYGGDSDSDGGRRSRKREKKSRKSKKKKSGEREKRRKSRRRDDSESSSGDSSGDRDSESSGDDRRSGRKRKRESRSRRNRSRSRSRSRSRHDKSRKSSSKRRRSDSE